MFSIVITAIAATAATANDSLELATQLPDVEVVGVKQTADATLQLQTVIDAQQAQRAGVHEVRGISQIAPNFFIPAYGSRMTSSIYVRGLGARIDQPVVGLNVDNVPYLNKDNYDFGVVDISRIEVVRGNAGVLNGRNAMAGQINITTLSPWAWHGVRFAAMYGRGNTARVSAGVYGRVTDNVATSLTAQYHHTDGFYRNDFDGSHCGEETNWDARWKTSWHPHTRWSVANTASLSHGRQWGYPYQSLATGRLAYNDPSTYRRAAFADGLTASYTGRRMVATSITSVQYLDDKMILDQDFLPEDYFTMMQKRREWALTQDLFAKGTRRSYSWLVGVFGFYKSTDMLAPVTFANTGISRLLEDNINSHLPQGMQLRWDSRQMLLDSNFDSYDGGFALYHQSELALGNWVLQAGLRWDIERVSLHYVSSCNTSATMGRVMPNNRWMPMAQKAIDIYNAGKLAQTFSQLLPQVSVRYAPLKSFDITASVAKGYKAGGYNTQMFSDVLQQQLMQQMGTPVEYDLDDILSYKPEKSVTYELTLGARTDDNRLSGTVTGFVMSCRNQQLTVFPHGNTTGRAMTNAGRTRSRGVELSVEATPTDNLTVNASYGYTLATFTRYNNGLADFSGKRLPYAPSNTLFASATYRLPRVANAVTPSLTLNARGAGNIMWNDENTVSQPFYATLGAELMLEHRYGSLSLWGENITNTHYNTFYFVSIGNGFVQRAEPWRIGATLRINLSR